MYLALLLIVFLFPPDHCLELKGFELLDTLQPGFVTAGESVVQAETPFSPQLSICYWFNQEWQRERSHFGVFEVRSTLSKKLNGTPSNSNWPTVYGLVRNSKVEIQSVHGFSPLKKKIPNISLLRKWIHVCFSLDFNANEVQTAINGEVLEKVKDLKTSRIYQNQLGGENILQESENSTFFFTFGRYHIDDGRHIIKIAGVNAWNHTFNDKELSKLSSCTQSLENVKDGNLISAQTKWKYPTNDPFIKESTYDLSSLLCTERRNERVVPMAIPLDTKTNVIDVCKKFGSDVNLAGTIRDIKDIEYYVQIIELSKHFKTSCGSPTGGRYFSWVPYNILTNGTIIHDLTGEIFNQPLFSPDYTVDKDHVDVISYYGNMMEMDGRLYGVKKGTKACGMCLIPNSVEKTTVVRLRGVCKYLFRI